METQLQLLNQTKIISMRFSIILLTSLSIHFGAQVNLSAQAVTGGPGQPEFSSFEPISSGHQVDPYTGNFSYSIPLVTLEAVWIFPYRPKLVFLCPVCVNFPQNTPDATAMRHP